MHCTFVVTDLTDYGYNLEYCIEAKNQLQNESAITAANNGFMVILSKLVI